jgi:hypothetical protein
MSSIIPPDKFDRAFHAAKPKEWEATIVPEDHPRYRSSTLRTDFKLATPLYLRGIDLDVRAALESKCDKRWGDEKITEQKAYVEVGGDGGMTWDGWERTKDEHVPDRQAAVQTGQYDPARIELRHRILKAIKHYFERRGYHCDLDEHDHHSNLHIHTGTRDPIATFTQITETLAYIEAQYEAGERPLGQFTLPNFGFRINPKRTAGGGPGFF